MLRNENIWMAFSKAHAYHALGPPKTTHFIQKWAEFGYWVGQLIRGFFLLLSYSLTIGELITRKHGFWRTISMVAQDLHRHKECILATAQLKWTFFMFKWKRLQFAYQNRKMHRFFGGRRREVKTWGKDVANKDGRWERAKSSSGRKRNTPK